jgi:hypothetical protein
MSDEQLSSIGETEDVALNKIKIYLGTYVSCTDKAKERCFRGTKSSLESSICK